MAELRNATADRWDLDKGFREERLGPCFTRGISFGDLDAETECNDWFLCIEGKRENELLSAGQYYTNAARVRDGRTVLIIQGEPPYGVRYYLQFTATMRGKAGFRRYCETANAERQAATLSDVHRFCREWQEWAEATPRPLRQAA
jgi:hypothetical protein